MIRTLCPFLQMSSCKILSIFYAVTIHNFKFRFLVPCRSEDSEDSPICDRYLREARQRGPGEGFCPFPDCETPIESPPALTDHLTKVHHVRKASSTNSSTVESDRDYCKICPEGSRCRLKGLSPQNGGLRKHYKALVLRYPCPYPECTTVEVRPYVLADHVQKDHHVKVKEYGYFTPKFGRWGPEERHPGAGGSNN